MSDKFAQIVKLIEARDVFVSAHGLERLQSKAIALSELTSDIRNAEIIEDYPDDFAGPAVLVLYSNLPKVHAVWGIQTGTNRPAVLVTAYRPDPSQWSPDFRKRLP